MKQDNFLTLQQDIDSLRATEPENTYLLYAMGLRLGTMDYYSLRLNNLLDGPDDKKVDFFHIDNDTGVCTIAQGYFSDDWTRRDPPAAKAWDLRVIDPIQRRLQSQFAEINISYQLRRSVARRRPNDVLFEKLAPFLSAFYGDPFSAHRNRPELFENERRYRELFSDESRIRNLLFIYRLGDAVAYAKSLLRDKVVSQSATAEEQKQYDLFRYGAFLYVLIHVCAEVLGVLLNAERRDFKRCITASDEILLDQEQCIQVLVKLVFACLKLSQSYLEGRNAYEVIRSQSGVEGLSRQAKTLVSQVQGLVPDTYAGITQHLRIEQ